MAAQCAALIAGGYCTKRPACETWSRFRGVILKCLYFCTLSQTLLFAHFTSFPCSLTSDSVFLLFFEIFGYFLFIYLHFLTPVVIGESKEIIQRTSLYIMYNNKESNMNFSSCYFFFLWKSRQVLCFCVKSGFYIVYRGKKYQFDYFTSGIVKKTIRIHSQPVLQIPLFQK